MKSIIKRLPFFSVISFVFLVLISALPSSNSRSQAQTKSCIPLKNNDSDFYKSDSIGLELIKKSQEKSIESIKYKMVEKNDREEINKKLVRQIMLKDAKIKELMYANLILKKDIMESMAQIVERNSEIGNDFDDSNGLISENIIPDTVYLEKPDTIYIQVRVKKNWFTGKYRVIDQKFLKSKP